MPQKYALMRVLAFVQSSVFDDQTSMIAARTICVLSWLHDLNWHSEADALESKARSTPRLVKAFAAFQEDPAKNAKMDIAVSLLSWLYGWTITGGEWKATKGTALVDELWTIINRTTETDCLYNHDHGKSKECVFNN